VQSTATSWIQNEEDQTECHAGVHTLEKDAHGVIWFYVAFTKHISVFSKEIIEDRSDNPISSKGNKFDF